MPILCDTLSVVCEMRNRHTVVTLSTSTYRTELSLCQQITPFSSIIAVSEERLLSRVCKKDLGRRLHLFQAIAQVAMLESRIPKAPKNRYNGGNWSRSEQWVSASSIPDGQSSTPLHHTLALMQASNSGHRYWHSSAFIHKRPNPLGGTSLLQGKCFFFINSSRMSHGTERLDLWESYF